MPYHCKKPTVVIFVSFAISKLCLLLLLFRNQLVEQLRHVREEKRRLRRIIRDLEADVLRKGTGSFSSSTSEAESIYAQYRHARAKLRLLEALVAKHDGSATL